jgi:hypothetical protein
MMGIHHADDESCLVTHDEGSGDLSRSLCHAPGEVTVRSSGWWTVIR